MPTATEIQKHLSDEHQEVDCEGTFMNSEQYGFGGRLDSLSNDRLENNDVGSSTYINPS